MEEYTIEQFREAAQVAGFKDAADEIIDTLTRSKFSEGQVAYDCVNDEYFAVVGGEIGMEDCRPLNQAEVGPDWVPVEVKDAAVKLRDCAAYAYLQVVGDQNIRIHKELKKAVAEFDEVVK